MNAVGTNAYGDRGRDKNRNRRSRSGERIKHPVVTPDGVVVAWLDGHRNIQPLRPGKRSAS